jgi:hypothetical protein
MVEVLFWVVLTAYILYISQVLISLIYWLLCLSPLGITFKKSPTKEIRELIWSDLSSNILRLLILSIYPLYILWGTWSFSYGMGVFNMLLLLFEVTIMQIVCRDSRTLSDDYEKVMPNFAKYFKYVLFRYSRVIQEIANG